MRRRLRARVLPCVLLCCCAAVGSAQGLAAAGVYPLIFSGRVLLADAIHLELRHVGTLSPAGREVAADSTGRIWGRLEPKSLAALDPARDRIVARIGLPRGPAGLLLTPEGKGYVTHGSPSRDGFLISVVDTREAKLLRQLAGLAGMPVGLAQAAGFVYVAALGILRSDPLEAHLYRIDVATDQLREVLNSSDPGYSWGLAAAGGRLYLGYLPLKNDPRYGRIEARDARTLVLAGKREDLPGPLQGLYATERQVLLFCADRKGGTILLLLDPLLAGQAQVHALDGPFAGVLGIHGTVLVYQDYRQDADAGKVNVCFYDLGGGRELKRINVRGFLSHQGDIYANEKIAQ